ncbi:hypothetical protein T231_17460 [Tannerella sp. oral taxon BU063 isolate Cell 6/7/9]|uniref:Uncharacterized protein n=1 Tax=Tannerella sp. oral taxon BU063 isolate Cell 6/7/9 TaxID=1411021 RepID=W2CJS1_9BACT|nr:hypothetical protein T231_17460 [Tannerella sp. oral taxon BU063 isolate Cell 6/7/9]
MIRLLQAVSLQCTLEYGLPFVHRNGMHCQERRIQLFYAVPELYVANAGFGIIGRPKVHQRVLSGMFSEVDRATSELRKDDLRGIVPDLKSFGDTCPFGSDG